MARVISLQIDTEKELVEIAGKHFLTSQEINELIKKLATHWKNTKTKKVSE